MPPAKHELTPHEREVIQANTANDAAESLGVDRSTVSRWARDNGITFKRIYKPSTEETRRRNKQIRAARRAGLSVKEIMTQYDVPGWKVRALLRIPNKGEVFKHLDAATTDWLERECPDGMRIHEFIAVLVKDAYQEDQE